MSFLRKPKNLSLIIISLVSIIIALLLMLAANYFLDGNFGAKILNNIALTLLIAATLQTAFNFFAKEDLIDSIKNEIASSIKKIDNRVNKFQGIGLVEIYKNANHYDFTNVIEESKELIITLNDGKRWTSTHFDSIQKRIMNPELSTIFIFPLLQDGMNYIMLKKTKHEDDPEDYIKLKRDSVIKDLKNIAQKSSGNLKIFLHPYFNVYASFISEDIAIITPYRISSGKQVVPLYIFKAPENVNENCEKNIQKCITCSNANEYCRIYLDIKKLLEESQQIYPEKS